MIMSEHVNIEVTSLSTLANAIGDDVLLLLRKHPSLTLELIQGAVSRGRACVALLGSAAAQEVIGAAVFDFAPPNVSTPLHANEQYVVAEPWYGEGITGKLAAYIDAVRRSSEAVAVLPNDFSGEVIEPLMISA